MHVPDLSGGDIGCKDEVVALANENKIFKQLIEVLDRQETYVRTEKNVEEHYYYK